MIVCSCGNIMNVDKTVLIEEVSRDGRSYQIWASDRLACNCSAVVYRTAILSTAVFGDKSYPDLAAECVMKFDGGRG